ncbi:hypothetical protein [Leptospirillum ferriphilum]|uniref:Uncharacterized protein n=1 Tax=Leptospirillum ferriphilum YSK TaxID=1441628 RepID=A0A059XY84_9BACT|nr:hypothetical protein [Leptospirillum ferriphilum]AIA31843.1 hypothetical protein Y981_08860 [Leptospirillum ferriphilum YSK]OOH82159.1 hypothetical protein BOX30_04065 [Leptospirillum ferriphilum]
MAFFLGSLNSFCGVIDRFSRFYKKMVYFFLSFFASGSLLLLFSNPGLSDESRGVPWVYPHSACCGLDLRSLVVRSRMGDDSVHIPRSLAEIGVRSVVFQFLGNRKVFVGVLVRGLDARGKILRHGLFDQGPIDEVLTREYFGRVMRVHVRGVFLREGTRYLVLGRPKTGKEAWIPLRSALSVLLSRVGRQKDLLWGSS